MVDFTQSLQWNLDLLGVLVQADAGDPQRRKWSIPGRELGSFDAHEGWCVLRHYNRTADWLIAIRDGMGELHYGWQDAPALPA